MLPLPDLHVLDDVLLLVPCLAYIVLSLPARRGLKAYLRRTHDVRRKGSTFTSSPRVCGKRRYFDDLSYSLANVLLFDPLLLHDDNQKNTVTARSFDALRVCV